MKEFDSLIYLLYIDTPDGRLYKIGHTKHRLQKRLSQLQTGCPYEIKVMETFDSIYGQLIERTLHNRYSHCKMFGEWFNIDISVEVNFISLCENYELLNDSLNKN